MDRSGRKVWIELQREKKSGSETGEIYKPLDSFIER